MEPPNDLKPVLPFLNRAKELEEREPLMAYYCRYCAVKTGMALMNSSNKAAVQGYLSEMMDELESMRSAFQEGGGTIPNEQTGKEYVEAFAYKIFLQADNEDRTGIANDKTAKKFLFSSTFYDVLKVFGPLSQEVIAKQRYAKWKASDIIKAIKEGRKPTPGPPGGDPNLPPNIAAGAPPAQQSPSSVYMPPTQQPPTHSSLPPPSSSYFPTQPSSQRPPSSSAASSIASAAAAAVNAKARPPPAMVDSDDDEDFGPTFDPEVISNVQKYCKFAISALNYEDIGTAVDNLEKSLAILRKIQKS